MIPPNTKRKINLLEFKKAFYKGRIKYDLRDLGIESSPITEYCLKLEHIQPDSNLMHWLTVINGTNEEKKTAIKKIEQNYFLAGILFAKENPKYVNLIESNNHIEEIYDEQIALEKKENDNKQNYNG